MEDEDLARVFNAVIDIKIVSVEISKETKQKYFSQIKANEWSEVVEMTLNAWFAGKEATYV
ncbi:MAG: hypothetical protein HDQ95_11815 [Roseburia sp.]|nr:hypothetical protein [Roseburia sp.]